MNFEIVKAKIFKMEFKKIVKYDQKKFFLVTGISNKAVFN